MRAGRAEDMDHAQAGTSVTLPSVAPSLGRHMKWIVPLVIAIAGFLIWRQKSPAEPAASKLPARDVPYLEGKKIHYSEAFATRAGLTFAPAQTRSLSPIVHVTGTVTFDPDRVADVGARIAGRVRAVRKQAGDAVKPGDVLAEIESAELGQAQAALMSARAHADAATANLKREKELAEAKISSYREFEVATATAASARADLAAAEQRLSAMGGTIQGEAGVLYLRSPIHGKVVARNLARGQFVEPTLTAFRVADLQRVWLQLAVFERDLAAVRAGDGVDIVPQSDVNVAVKGVVDYVGEVIDLETKTADVRVVITQPDISLRPGQSVVAQIHTRTQLSRVVLPREAVTSVDGKPTVFVANAALSVDPRQVQLGSEDAQFVEIDGGLKAGEQVAVTGVFALKSEIFR